MKGWEQTWASETDDFIARVYDKDSQDYMELILTKEGTIKVLVDTEIELGEFGIENLRKRLQSAERYLKDGQATTT